MRVGQAKLASIHRAAAAAAGEADSPWHAIRGVRDPLERLALDLSHHPDGVSTLELSNLLADALGNLAVPERWVLARNLFPIATARGCLNVSAFELISGPMQKLAAFCANPKNVFQIRRDRMPEWNALLARAGEREAQLGNLMLALFAVENQKFGVASSSRQRAPRYPRSSRDACVTSYASSGRPPRTLIMSSRSWLPSTSPLPRSGR